MTPFDLLFCPVCETAGDRADSRLFTPLAKDPPAYRCVACGLGIEARLSTHPAGDYARESYDHHRNAGVGGARWERFHHDTAVAAARLAQLAPVLPQAPGAWVDVGCSAGAHLALLRRRGWLVLGVEADPPAAAEVTKVLGLPVVDFAAWLAVAGGRPDVRAQPVTVISFFDVVEHLLDPVGVLKAATNSIAPDGLLVIEVPDLAEAGGDFAGWKHRRLGPRKDVRDVPEVRDHPAPGGWVTEHVWHFSAASLDALRVRHLPDLAPAKPPAAPVPGKLQVVWRKAARPASAKTGVTDDQAKAALVAAAVSLLRLPEDQRHAHLADLRKNSEDGYRAVTAELQRLHDLAHQQKG